MAINLLMGHKFVKNLLLRNIIHTGLIIQLTLKTRIAKRLIK